MFWKSRSQKIVTYFKWFLSLIDLIDLTIQNTELSCRNSVKWNETLVHQESREVMLVIFGHIPSLISALGGKSSSYVEGVRVNPRGVTCAPDVQIVLDDIWHVHGRSYPHGTSIVAVCQNFGTVFLAVDLFIGVVGLVREVCFQAQMLTTLTTPEVKIVYFKQ